MKSSRSPQSRSVLQLVLVLLFLLFSLGCDCSEGDSSSAFGPQCDEEITNGNGDNGSGGEPGSSDRLIVSDAGAVNLRVIPPSTTNGEVATRPVVQGELTRLARPQFLTLLSSENQLVVPDEGGPAILFYSNIADMQGNVPPVRLLRGNATELVGPVQVFIDSGNDELYVLDRGANAVLVYANASGIDGEIAPIRRIRASGGEIVNPAAFMVDVVNNRLTIINPTSVVTFESIRELNGAVPPAGRLEGSATTFLNLSYGTMNGTTLVLADNGSDSLLFFEDFQFDRNNIAPNRTVNGNNTGISEPGQFYISASSDEIVLTNGNNILLFREPDEIQGNPFPAQRLIPINPVATRLRGILPF